MANEKDINASPDNNSPSPPDAKPKKKGKGKLIFFLVLLLFIGGIAAVLALNLFGFRENVIMPYLRNAPIIGGFLPAAYEEEEELTPEELHQRYTILTQQLESVQNQLAQANEQNLTYEALIEHLRAFEDAWHLYRAARAELEQMLALGDPVNFIEFFDFVSEDNLELLYFQAMQMAAYIEDLTAIVATLNNMDESGAGEVLEALMTTDTQLMIDALWMMTPTRRAEIFDTLEAEVVTRMILLMSPDEPVFMPILPPELPEFPPPIGLIPPEFAYMFTVDYVLEMLRENVPEDVWNEMGDEHWNESAEELVAILTSEEMLVQGIQLMFSLLLEDEFWAYAVDAASEEEEEEVEEVEEAVEEEE